MNELEASLKSAIIWCGEKLNWKDLGSCHRSPELFPKPVKSSEDSNITYLEFNAVQVLLTKIITKRNRLVDRNIGTLSARGRILCFYPEYSLNDAMVAHECQVQIDAIHSGSNGEYIDDFDNPPWDTWLYCEKNENVIALYSWVHPELVGFVSRAIATDAYGCLVWAEKLEKQLNLKS
jgi:hypothetical protein